MSLVGRAAESGTGSISTNASSPTVMVTNAQGANLILKLVKLLITNPSQVTDYWVRIYKVPSGAGAAPFGDNYIIWKELKIRMSDGTLGTEDVREVVDLHLENGDSLQAYAESGSALKFDLSYFAES